MEELPPELVAELYPYLSSEDYRQLQSTGRRYRNIGEDPYLLRTEIVRGDGWLLKTNSRGDCLNSLFYSTLKTPEDKDLVDGKFIYQYSPLDYPNLTSYVDCPFDTDGYLSGTMNIYTYLGKEPSSIFQIPMVKGKAHGKAEKISDMQPNKQFILDNGIIISPWYKSNLNPVYYMEQGFSLADYSFGFDDMMIGYINGIGIIDVINFDANEHYMLTENKDRYLIRNIDEDTTEGEVSSTDVLDYLPKSLTNRNIPIFKDNIEDLILPLNLYNCSSRDKIEENVVFLINRYLFYIDVMRRNIY